MHGALAIKQSAARPRPSGVFHDGLKGIPAIQIREYPESTGSLGDQKRLCAHENQRETLSMNKRSLLSMSVILSTAIATPVFAQAITQEPDARALYLPSMSLGTEDALAQRRDMPAVDRGAAEAMASSPSTRPWTAGNETKTKPWSAPLGHHQPSAADVIEAASASRPVLDQEDARVDQIVRGICRGC
jgi:hypothetical protein